LRSGKASNSGLLLKLVEDKFDTGGGSNFSYFKTLLKIKINKHILIVLRTEVKGDFNIHGTKYF